MAGTLSSISIISFIAAGIFLLAAIVFFFVFNIPNVLGDLSGRNARRSLEKQRRNNEQAGRKMYASGKKKPAGRKSAETAKMGKKNKNLSQMPETGLLHENQRKNLTEHATEILVEKTQLLQESYTMGSPGVHEPARSRGKANILFKYIDDIVLIHTSEVIS